jgi:alpha-galactosidase/6-phospho-beta-glucosidase family protein
MLAGSTIFVNGVDGDCAKAERLPLNELSFLLRLQREADRLQIL